MGRTKQSTSRSEPAAGSSTATAPAARDAGHEVKLADMLRELRTLIDNVAEERSRNEHNLANISKAREKVLQEQKLSTYFKGKLKSMYNTAMQDAESEFDVLQKALKQIQDIKQIREKGMGERPKQILRRGVLMSMLQQSAHMLPLWCGKPGEAAPPLCGAIPAEPNYICVPGSKVAARVKSEDAEENWILSEVRAFNQATNKYDVDDIDAEEGKERHTLSKRRIVPLPLYKADPETNYDALFPKGALVLALYPQTTCFYRALIHIQPDKHSKDYSVLFEDTSYQNGYSPPLLVSQRFIITCKDDKKK